MIQKPLKCHDCQRCIAVIYMEIVGQSKNVFKMRQDYPILKEKVKEKSSQEERLKKKEAVHYTHRGTSLASVLIGDYLGCSQCYYNFEETLTSYLLETKQISRCLKSSATGLSSVFYVGSVPLKSQRSKKSAHIRELKEALREAIRGENYKEAAWLRDQINALTQRADDDS